MPSRSWPGGVISPLLANLYLHWFDKVFHGPNGPARWANARLVRYADDFVVLARQQGTKLTGFIESKIETWLDLEITREKTKVVHLNEPGESLDFLGCTFRYDDDLKGRGWQYLNVVPVGKGAETRTGEAARNDRLSAVLQPIPDLVEELNLQLKGWANYFSFGYPREAFREINTYVRYRLEQHLKRRSQRPFRPPEGVSFHDHFKKLGLVYL